MLCAESAATIGGRPVLVVAPPRPHEPSAVRSSLGPHPVATEWPRRAPARSLSPSEAPKRVVTAQRPSVTVPSPSVPVGQPWSFASTVGWSSPYAPGAAGIRSPPPAVRSNACTPLAQGRVTPDVRHAAPYADLGLRTPVPSPGVPSPMAAPVRSFVAMAPPWQTSPTTRARASAVPLSRGGSLTAVVGTAAPNVRLAAPPAARQRIAPPTVADAPASFPAGSPCMSPVAVERSPAVCTYSTSAALSQELSTNGGGSGILLPRRSYSVGSQGSLGSFGLGSLESPSAVTIVTQELQDVPRNRSRSSSPFAESSTKPLILRNCGRECSNERAESKGSTASGAVVGPSIQRLASDSVTGVKRISSDSVKFDGRRSSAPSVIRKSSPVREKQSGNEVRQVRSTASLTKASAPPSRKGSDAQAIDGAATGSPSACKPRPTRNARSPQTGARSTPQSSNSPGTQNRRVSTSGGQRRHSLGSRGASAAAPAAKSRPPGPENGHVDAVQQPEHREQPGTCDKADVTRPEPPVPATVTNGDAKAELLASLKLQLPQRDCGDVGAIKPYKSNGNGVDVDSESEYESDSGSDANDEDMFPSSTADKLLQSATDRILQMHAAAGSSLLRAALTNVVPGDEAMHPYRAYCGDFLLRHVVEHAAPSVAAPDDDSVENVLRRLFLDSMPSKYVEIDCIEQVCAPRLLMRFLARVGEHRACVEATFHGTRGENVPEILRHGLCPAMCSTGVYGQGAYVGTHAGVAHQYADPDGEGLRYMCVILVVVGSNVQKGHEGERPQTTAMDRLVNPTQYCFVDESRLYVSHVITYHTVDGGRRRIGGGWSDPFQVRLSQAVRKAAQRRRNTGIR